MKKILFVFSVLFLLFGCNKDNNPKNNTFTNEQIEQAYQIIKVTADSILLSDDPIAEFGKMVEEYEKMEDVKYADVTSVGLVVEYARGEVMCWYVNQYIGTLNSGLQTERVKQIADTEIKDATTSGKSVLILFQAM